MRRGRQRRPRVIVTNRRKSQTDEIEQRLRVVRRLVVDHCPQRAGRTIFGLCAFVVISYLHRGLISTEAALAPAAAHNWPGSACGTSLHD